MAAPAQICLLRRVADRLRAGELGEDGVLLAVMLDDYLANAHSGRRLDEAFGVSISAGGEFWWRRESRERRATWLREYSSRYGCGASALATVLREYRRHWQVRDSHLAELPSAYIGTPRELLYLAFCERDAGDMPSSEKQLRRILSEGHETPPIRVRGAVVDAQNTFEGNDASYQQTKKIVERRRFRRRREGVAPSDRRDRKRA